MINLNVYNRQGESVGTVDVDPADFGGKVNKQLLHDVVIMYLANQRAGTHSTLRRGEVSGSTKKLFRQKGTGNARAATRMAILSKFQDNEAVVLDDLTLGEVKTKQVATLLKALKLHETTCLIG